MRRWRGRIRELAALSGALAALLGLLLWGASPAAAGGPTSVLVTSPQSGEATALYYSDGQYGQLQQLLGPENTGSRDKPPEADLAHARQINVTWLAHDISPWRLDRVFPVGSKPYAVWIHTAANVPESPNGYWHRAEHPGRLRALFKKLGVMGRTTGGDGYTGIFPAPWQSDTPSAAPEEPTTTTASITTGTRDDGSDWWWAIPGAGAGAALALVLRPVAKRLRPLRWRREREPGPRQELRDV